jgi:hypothetical protein
MPKKWICKGCQEYNSTGMFKKAVCSNCGLKYGDKPPETPEPPKEAEEGVQMQPLEVLVHNQMLIYNKLEEVLSLLEDAEEEESETPLPTIPIEKKPKKKGRKKK